MDFSSVKAVSAQPQISSLAAKISAVFLSISSQAVCFPISISPFLYMISGCSLYHTSNLSKRNSRIPVFRVFSEFLYKFQPVITNYTISFLNPQPFLTSVRKVTVIGGSASDLPLSAASRPSPILSAATHATTNLRKSLALLYLQ